MSRFRSLFVLVLGLVVLTSCSQAPTNLDMPSQTHEDLVSFFEAWREFRVPPAVDGVPDFSRETIACAME